MGDLNLSLFVDAFLLEQTNGSIRVKGELLMVPQGRRKSSKVRRKKNCKVGNELVLSFFSSSSSYSFLLLYSLTVLLSMSTLSSPYSLDWLFPFYWWLQSTRVEKLSLWLPKCGRPFLFFFFSLSPQQNSSSSGWRIFLGNFSFSLSLSSLHLFFLHSSICSCNYNACPLCNVILSFLLFLLLVFSLRFLSLCLGAKNSSENEVSNLHQYVVEIDLTGHTVWVISFVRFVCRNHSSDDLSFLPLARRGRFVPSSCLTSKGRSVSV